MTNYEEWQLNCYGNILPDPNIEIEEPGEDEARRFESWTNNEHEKQLNELK